MSTSIELLRTHEIPGQVAVVTGTGGLPKIVVTAKSSTAEIYPHGAHVTHFQKKGEPPLIFLSAKSWFAPGKPIRGGVPICWPWFGPRGTDVGHGFARVATWKLVHTAAMPDGTVSVHFALTKVAGREQWKFLRAEFVVTVAETLTMDLTTTNESCDATLEIEDCLHTYFHVGDISAVWLSGLQNAPFGDFAFGTNGVMRNGDPAPLRITQETNRVYPDNSSAVEIRDEKLQRIICVEKFNSQSTVVWNPWTTQKMPEDWGQDEHRQMVCVESGNVKQNKILLAPGQTASLKVVLSSRGS